jgi:hypothetical protein
LAAGGDGFAADLGWFDHLHATANSARDVFHKFMREVPQSTMQEGP